MAWLLKSLSFSARGHAAPVAAETVEISVYSPVAVGAL